MEGTLEKIGLSKDEIEVYSTLVQLTLLNLLNN